MIREDRRSQDPRSIGDDRGGRRIADALSAGRSVLLVGPIGSGKTHVLRNVSELLRRAGTVVRNDPRAVTDGEVLALDDVNDRQDVGAIGELIRSERVTALLTASTASSGRNRGRDRSSAMIATLWLDGFIERIDLRELNEQAAAALLDELDEAESLDRLSRTAVVARADGSRLLLREFASEAAKATASRADLFTMLRDPAPGSRLDDALHRHLDSYDSDTRWALTLLGRLPGLSTADVMRLVPVDAVERLLRRGLVSIDGARLTANASVATAAARRVDPADIDAALALSARRMLEDGGRWFCAPLAVELVLAWLRSNSDMPGPEDVDDALQARIVDAAVQTFAERGAVSLAAAAASLRRFPARAPTRRLPDRGLALLHSAESRLLDLRVAAARDVAERAASSGRGDVQVVARALSLLAAAIGGDGSETDWTPMIALGDRAYATEGNVPTARARAVACCAEVLARRFQGTARAGAPERRERARRAAVHADDHDAMRGLTLAETLAVALDGDLDGARRELAALSILRSSESLLYPREWGRMFDALIAEQFALLGGGHLARRLLTEHEQNGPSTSLLVRAIEHGARATLSLETNCPDEAAAHAALDAFRLAGASPEAERCRVRLALMQNGSLAATTSAVDTTAVTASEPGLTARSSRMATLRIAQGHRAIPRTAIASSLTAREREISALIGDGLSNRQIAARLVLSVRTVESHVYQARAKLDLRSRRDLGTLARIDHDALHS